MLLSLIHIFMEYHAIEDAEAWHKIQDVLEERVKAGVEVRVFYDDMGSIGFIKMCIRDRGRTGKVKSLQWLLTHSFYGRALAVKRVTSNKGKIGRAHV